MSDNAPTQTLDDTALDRLAEKVTSKLGEWLRLHRERLLNIDELAERVGLSERGVRGLIKRHELPEGFEIGGCRRWSWPHPLTRASCIASFWHVRKFKFDKQYF